MSIADIIAFDLRLPASIISRIADGVQGHYRVFQINGRHIAAPDSDLKMIQTWIADFVRSETDTPPDYVTAYEPKSSIAKNASMHLQNKHLLTLDVHHFFESWDATSVGNYFMGMSCHNLGAGTSVQITEKDAKLLANLATYKDHLVMGSPCSPALANRLMGPVDEEIIGRLPSPYAYTRYSDDIAISSPKRIDAPGTISIIKNALDRVGLTLNDKKMHCRGSGDGRRITGLYITPDGKLSIGKRRKQRLTRMVYSYLVAQDVDQIVSVDELYGYLSFCGQIEPSFVANLISKYSNYGRARNSPSGLMGLLRGEMRKSAQHG